MGNQNVKGSAETPFTQDEMKILEASFRQIGGHSDRLQHDKIVNFWDNIIDHRLAICTANYLASSVEDKSKAIVFKHYAQAYYIIEHGTIDEKSHLLYKSLRNQNLKELDDYITSVVKSYIHLETNESDKSFTSWKEFKYQSSDRTIQAFAKGLTRSFDSNTVDFSNSLERWLHLSPIFLLIWREVFAYMYSKPAGKHHKLGNQSDIPILPICTNMVHNDHYFPILEIPQLIFINSNLPREHRHKWRFLFSSKIMGESFSTLLGKITHQGPTLFIVEDEDHYIFGGYAPETWALKPKFVGDETSMLFTISPAVRFFNSSGFNNHYQYLNMNQQTMPNGLGMGGQFNYWGLWIDSDYGQGQSSESCTTYRDYVQLSKRKDFRIRNIEVWGVGDLPESDDDNDSRANVSILDGHLADRAVLEMTGKKMHSDGLREVDKS